MNKGRQTTQPRKDYFPLVFCNMVLLQIDLRKINKYRWHGFNDP